MLNTLFKKTQLAFLRNSTALAQRSLYRFTVADQQQPPAQDEENAQVPAQQATEQVVAAEQGEAVAEEVPAQESEERAVVRDSGLSTCADLIIEDPYAIYYTPEEMSAAVEAKLSSLEEKYPLDFRTLSGLTADKHATMLNNEKQEVSIRENLNRLVRSSRSGVVNERAINLTFYALRSLLKKKQFKLIEEYLEHFLNVIPVNRIKELLPEGYLSAYPLNLEHTCVAVGKLLETRDKFYLRLLRHSRVIASQERYNIDVVHSRTATDGIRGAVTLNAAEKVFPDQLEFYYRLYSLLPQSMPTAFNLEDFVEEVKKLSFGEQLVSSPAKQYSARSLIAKTVDHYAAASELFSYFLAEVFFMAPTYQQALQDLSVTLLVLSRVESLASRNKKNSDFTSNMDDLFSRLPSNTFVSNFETKLLNLFHSAADNGANKAMEASAKIYKQALENFNMFSSEGVKPRIHTALDYAYFYNSSEATNQICSDGHLAHTYAPQEPHNPRGLISGASTQKPFQAKASVEEFLKTRIGSKIFNNYKASLRATQPKDATKPEEIYVAGEEARALDKYTVANFIEYFKQSNNGQLEYARQKFTKQIQEENKDRKKLGQPLLPVKETVQNMLGLISPDGIHSTAVGNLILPNDPCPNQYSQLLKETLSFDYAGLESRMVEMFRNDNDIYLEYTQHRKQIDRDHPDLSQDQKALYSLSRLPPSVIKGSRPQRLYEIFQTPSTKIKRRRLQREGRYKKGAASFSTVKPEIKQENAANKDEGLLAYLAVMKDVDQQIKNQANKNPNPITTLSPVPSQTDLSLKKVLESVYQFEIKLQSAKSFEEAVNLFKASISPHFTYIDTLLNISRLPYFKSGKDLFMGTFLYSSSASFAVQPSPMLQCEFESSIGTLDRNYNKYLEHTFYAFELSPKTYNLLLSEIQTKYERLHFKRVLAHIAYFAQKLDANAATTITNIVVKERTGITLLEFLSLVLKNKKFDISEQVFSILLNGLKSFKHINEDIMPIYKQMATERKWHLNPLAIEGYLGSLMAHRDTEKVQAIIKVLRDATANRRYKFVDSLTTQQNQKEEALFKEANKLEARKNLRKIISIAAKNNDPDTASPLLEEYLSDGKGQKEIKNPEDYSLAYLSFSTNQKRFGEVLKEQAGKPQTVNQDTLESVITAFERHPRVLNDMLEEALNTFVYTSNIPLSANDIDRISNIIRRLDNQTAFSRFLEYILRHQPEMNPDTKKLFYRIFINSKDDSSKQYIKGLLELIFDTSKAAQRAQYKKAREQEQAKQKKLSELKKAALAGLSANTTEVVAADKKQTASDSTATAVKKTQAKSSVSAPKASTSSTPNVPATTPAATSTTPEQKKLTKSEKKEKKKVEEAAANKKGGASDGRRDPASREMISLEDKKKIERKSMRRRGRDKFVEFVMTEEQLEEEWNQQQKKK